MYKSAFFATLAVATKAVSPASQTGFTNDQVNQIIAFSQQEGEGQEYDCTCACESRECWKECFGCLYPLFTSDSAEPEPECEDPWSFHPGKNKFGQGGIGGVNQSDFEDLDALKAYVVERGGNMIVLKPNGRAIMKFFDPILTEDRMDHSP